MKYLLKRSRAIIPAMRMLKPNSVAVEIMAKKKSAIKGGRGRAIIRTAGSLFQN